eukprot:1161833-Pelagomonas_calceolata.AAC.27
MACTGQLIPNDCTHLVLVSSNRNKVLQGAIKRQSAFQHLNVSEVFSREPSKGNLQSPVPARIEQNSLRASIQESMEAALIVRMTQNIVGSGKLRDDFSWALNCGK